MIKIRIDKNGFRKPIFKLSINDEDMINNRILKRVIYESKKRPGLYNYQVPMKYLLPILNNLPYEDFEIDTRSILSFLEFADNLEEQYYYALEANSKYMKKWREEGCPNIFRITINTNEKKAEKRIAFRKISR